MKIQKRDGRVVPYEEEKIREAIHKANNEVEERYRASEGLIEEILEDVQQEGKQTQTVEHIQDMIEEHLVEHKYRYPGQEIYCIPLPEKSAQKVQYYG